MSAKRLRLGWWFQQRNGCVTCVTGPVCDRNFLNAPENAGGFSDVMDVLHALHVSQALFATETFSTGLNMPAKTVVFTHARKFDGHSFRWLSSGEYIQMSGRAGRRGLDDRGALLAPAPLLPPRICAIL